MTPLGNSEHNTLLQPALAILLQGVCVFHKCIFADKCTHKCAILQKEKSHSSEVILQAKTAASEIFEHGQINSQTVSFPHYLLIIVKHLHLDYLTSL